MKRVLAFVLMAAMATAQIDMPPRKAKHHHRVPPVVIGMIAGAGAAVIIGLATRHNCPSKIFYDGQWHAYQGTPPCPGPNYDPGKKK